MNREKIAVWEKRKRIDWKIVCGLFFICFIQLCILGYFGRQKAYLMCDELFTYTSSNNAEIQAFDMPLNEWLDKGWYLSQCAAMEEHTFEYAIPYRNQAADVHPPLYYILMHTLSSFVPGKISFAAGVGLNIFFMLGCTILLYCLTKEIFGNTKIALLTASLFGITYGACNMVLFIRMYTMFAFLLLVHAYIYIHFLEKSELTWKSYLFLGITLILGVLTHYYFILAAFFLVVWYFIKLWYKKRFREECIFHVSIEVCALICLMIFPAMWKHIFNDYRGEGARKNLVQLNGFAGNLKTMFQYIDKQLFGGLLLFLILVAVGFMAIYLYRKKKFPWKELEKLWPVLFMTGGYFVLVTKIAPFITDRYLMPLYPFVFLIVVGGSLWLLKEIFPFRMVFAAGAVFFAGLSLHGLGQGAPAYAYTGFTAHSNLAKQYSNTYCVYIDREFNWWDYYGVIQLLKEYKGFYCISYAAITDDIKVGMKQIREEDEVIVYVGNSELDEEITSYIQETVGAEEMVLIDEYERWKIYLGERATE